ncbi:hypothetical protein FRC03_000704 [Tulasnella sp. 419]|nr:hypothetical protein FRC03_000704 [Tulasnella sp. 419]
MEPQILSPIHLLPCELLISILSLACLGCSTPEERFKLPCRLSQVSKLWNAIIVKTPTLSSLIYIHDNSVKEQLLQRITRSAGVALDVSIDNKPCSSLKPQMDIIAYSSGRWRSLEVNSWGSECIKLILPAFLPRLEELSIRCEDADVANGLAFSLTSDMPKLRRAVLKSLPVTWSTCTLAGCNLESLELIRCGVSPEDLPVFLDFLESLKSLRRLVLDEIWLNFWEIGVTQRTITLPLLKELVYRGIPSGRVLNWIQSPNLEKLVVGRPLWAEGQRWMPVNISFHSVQHLELYHLSTSSAALINLLYSAPNARHITIVSSNLGRSMLFPDIVMQRGVWKELESLAIHGVFSLVQLKKVVLMHSSTIKRVNVHFLDCGLGMDASRHEFEEAADARDWLKKHVSLGVDRTTTTYGTRFRTWDDMVRGRLMKPNEVECYDL